MNFSSVSGKNWLFKKFNSSDVAKLSESYDLSEIVAKLLSIRKKNINDINMYLNPKIKNLLPSPLLLKDMKIAVDRTYNSINKGETLGIFGDYDVAPAYILVDGVRKDLTLQSNAEDGLVQMAYAIHQSCFTALVMEALSALWGSS